MFCAILACVMCCFYAYDTSLTLGAGPSGPLRALRARCGPSDPLRALRARGARSVSPAGDRGPAGCIFPAARLVLAARFPGYHLPGYFPGYIDWPVFLSFMIVFLFRKGREGRVSRRDFEASCLI